MAGVRAPRPAALAVLVVFLCAALHAATAAPKPRPAPPPKLKRVPRKPKSPPPPPPKKSSDKSPPPPVKKLPPPRPPQPPPPRPPPPPSPPQPRPPPPRRPPPPVCAALQQQCDVNPDCCSQNCEPSSRKCCRPNAISAANLKIFNAVILGPDDQCKIDTECCFRHCVPIDGKQACLPCVPANLGNCVEDGDCCFGSKCNKATQKCCISQGIKCEPQVGQTPPPSNSSLCCSGTCDVTTKTCTSCITLGETGCVTPSQCCAGAACQAGRCCIPSGKACITGFANCCSGLCTTGTCS